MSRERVLRNVITSLTFAIDVAASIEDWARYAAICTELEPLELELLAIEQRDRRARGVRGGEPSNER